MVFQVQSFDLMCFRLSLRPKSVLHLLRYINRNLSNIYMFSSFVKTLTCSSKFTKILDTFFSFTCFSEILVASNPELTSPSADKFRHFQTCTELLIAVIHKRVVLCRSVLHGSEHVLYSCSEATLKRKTTTYMFQEVNDTGFIPCLLRHPASRCVKRGTFPVKVNKL